MSVLTKATVRHLRKRCELLMDLLPRVGGLLCVRVPVLPGGTGSLSLSCVCVSISPLVNSAMDTQSNKVFKVQNHQLGGQIMAGFLF